MPNLSIAKTNCEETQTMSVQTPKEGEAITRVAESDKPDPARDLVRLAVAANPFQAHIWQQALQGEGIPCQVLGDYLDAGIGDIPGIGAEVWVETTDLERAEAILRQHQDRSGAAAPTDEES
jgi:hypothetical protein